MAHAPYDIEQIKTALAAQLRHGRYPASDIYYRPGVSQTMVDILARVPLYTQKRFHENTPANARIS